MHTHIEVPCAVCGVEQTIPVAASYLPGEKETWSSPGYPGMLDDVHPVDALPVACGYCAALLGPEFAARVDTELAGLTLEDFR